VGVSHDNSERPLLPILFYLLHEARTRFQDEYFRGNNFFWRMDSFGGRGQVGSLAGAAHLLNNNAGVPR